MTVFGMEKTPGGSGKPIDSDLPLFAAIEAARKAAEASAQDMAKRLAAEAPVRAMSVTELTQKIRSTLEPAFAQVWVEGEISNFKAAASGHIYFSLKDAQSNIAAAFFGWGARRAKGQGFDLKDGLRVLARGKVTVYGPRGSYQLSVDQIEPMGAGALQVAFEQLKSKLAAEGLFKMERKRRLPPYPLRIAVVTSPTGAVIQDMLNILKRRAPQIKVTVVPALVQGPEAPAQVLRGLEIANRHNLGDIIVIARGGGSMEDLWGFNDERLARAIGASALPVVSAVGHEVDFTIADFVADYRAPTPSAAAEVLSGGWVEVAKSVQEMGGRLKQMTLRDIQSRKTVLAHVGARLVSPSDRIREQMQRLDEWGVRLSHAWNRRIERLRSLLTQSAGQLDALSPLRVLERGYALARSKGVVIKSVQQIESGSEITLTFYDGETSVKAL